MKKKELKSYYTKKVSELQKELQTLRLDFDKIRLNVSAGREKNLKKAKNLGKKISQIMTILKIKSVEDESVVKEAKK